MYDIEVNISTNTLLDFEKYMYIQNKKLLYSVSYKYNLDYDTMINKFLKTPLKMKKNK